MAATRSISRRLVASFALVVLVAFTATAPWAPAGAEVAVQALGPERPVSDPVGGAPQPGGQPALASSGSVQLAVWVSSGVRAARVTPEGTVIDPSPIPVAPGGYPSYPTVGFDGQNFLVVWQGSPGVFAKRVSPDGVVLDAAPIVLTTGFVSNADVAFDGTNHLITWVAAQQVVGVFVRPDGTVASRLVITTANAGRSDLAFNGTQHLIVWEAYDPALAERDIRATLVTPQGAVSHPEGLPVSTAPRDQWNPTVVAVGTSFFVAWEDHRLTGVPDILGSRVDGNGVALDPAGIVISRTASREIRPQVETDGTNVLVTWEGPGVRAKRVGPSGAVLDPTALVLPRLTGEPAVAFDGATFLVAGASALIVRGARVSPAGAIVDPAAFPISVGANRQTEQDVATDGTNSFVVWTDGQSPGGGIYGGRVGPQGQILDGTGIAITTEAGASSPTVTYDGANYLVVWTGTQGSAVRGARISSAGVVLDRFDLAVPTSGAALYSPSVAYGGGTFLATWTSYAAETGYELRAARVSRDGVVQDPGGFPVSTEVVRQTSDVSFGSTAFLVVWSSFGSTDDIRGSLVTPAGTVPNPDGFPISAAAPNEAEPRLAWNGTSHLVVWESIGSDQIDSYDIYGARVDGSGTVLDPAGIAIATGTGHKTSPMVAANGRVLVTWLDRRRGRPLHDIFATEVRPDGTVVRPDGDLLMAPADVYGTIDLSLSAAPGTGNFSLAYGRDVAEQPFGTVRAFLRTISPK